jgi:hypothetical protein
MHRVHAAQLRGQEHIAARLFDGSEEEAFVLAVRLNSRHGLPLSTADRASAATRIMATHPQWSDRRIAGTTGLSAKSVAAIRRRSTEADPQSNARVGKDGRVRPLNSAEGRLRAGKLMADDPQASLREVAREAGIALATARDVRQRMLQGRDLLPPRLRQASPQTHPPELTAGQRPARGAPYEGGQAREPQRVRETQETHDAQEAGPAPRRAAPAVRPAATAVTLQSLRNDPSLRTEVGRQLLRLLSAHPVGPDQWQRLVIGVPSHRADAVTQLARTCAQEWLLFAREVETRMDESPSPDGT